MAGEIDDGKEQIADLGPDRYRIVEGVEHLVEFFSYLGDGAIVIGPIEADRCRPALQFQRPDECRQRRRDAVQHRGPPLLLPLQRLPIGQDVIGGLGLHVAEDVRVPSHQLAADRLGHLLDAEYAGFGGESGVEHHLQQEVTEFFFEVHVTLDVRGPGRRFERKRLDRIKGLVGLFEQVAGQ